MFKSTLVTLGIIGLNSFVMVQAALSAQPKSIDENAKEAATGKDKTPWQKEPSPPEVVNVKLSPRFVRSHKKHLKNSDSVGDTGIKPAIRPANSTEESSNNTENTNRGK